MILLYGEHDGKTRELIKRSSETGTVIVCYNSRRAEFVRCYAETMGMDIQKPISISDLQKGPHHGKILIDEVQDVFRAMLGMLGCGGIEVDAATLGTGPGTYVVGLGATRQEMEQ